VAPPRQDDNTYEYSYQRYQDRNYDFMHNKIGQNDKENVDANSEKQNLGQSGRVVYYSQFGKDQVQQ